MGWINESLCDHEGYSVGLVELEDRPGSGLLRELRYPYDETPRQDVTRAQAACVCGWRSPRLRVTASSWAPFSLLLQARDEERIYALWKKHVDDELQEHAAWAAVRALR